jgi:hypothetical protein
MWRFLKDVGIIVLILIIIDWLFNLGEFKKDKNNGTQ